MRTVSMVEIPSKNKLKITVGDTMKKVIKNITDNPIYGYELATLSYREDGKIITLKPGEFQETKMEGKNLSKPRIGPDGKPIQKRLRLMTEDEAKGKKKKEVEK